MRLRKLLSAQYAKSLRETKPGMDGDKCTNCDSKKSLKKCTGCYHFWYCSPDCLREDWDRHKPECKAINKEYKLCSNLFSSSRNKEDDKIKGHFVVKVKIEHSKDDDLRPPSMIISNKDKTFEAKLEKDTNETVFEELYQNIVSKGWNGRKGYFHVLVDKVRRGTVRKFKINSSRILKNESW